MYVYVDDILITGCNVTLINSVKAYLDQHFNIKDLGSLKYFLGIEIARSQKGVFLNQRKYTLYIITTVSLPNAKFSVVPMEYHHTLLSNDTSSFMDNITTNRQLVGRLIYPYHYQT